MFQRLTNLATILRKAGHTEEAIHILSLVAKAAFQTKEVDYKNLDNYLHWEDPKKAQRIQHNAVRELENEWEEYWSQAQQAGQRAAGPEDKQAAYENFVGTKKNLKDTEVETSLRKRVFGKEDQGQVVDPNDIQPGESARDWFNRIMGSLSGRRKVRAARVSDLLKDPDLRDNVKKHLDKAMKKDKKGPDSIDEAYDKLDDQVEEQMDEIVPPGKPDKTGKG